MGRNDHGFVPCLTAEPMTAAVIELALRNEMVRQTETIHFILSNAPTDRALGRAEYHEVKEAIDLVAQLDHALSHILTQVHRPEDYPHSVLSDVDTEVSW